MTRLPTSAWLMLAPLGFAVGCDSACPEVPAPGDRLRVEVVEHVESTGRACVPLEVGDTFTRTVWTVATLYDQTRYDENGECPEVSFAPEVPSFLSENGLGWECRDDVCVAEDTTERGTKELVGRLEMQWNVRMPSGRDRETGMLTVSWRAPSGRTCRSIFEVALSAEQRE